VDEDAQFIAAIEASVAPGPWSADAVEKTLARANAVAWVGTAAGEVVGHVLATVAGDVGEILTVAVHPAHRRRGVARTLMGAVQADWAERGVVEAFLEVSETNAGARSLYQGLRWVAVGRRRRYYRDGTDAIVMRLEVATAPAGTSPSS
jgi:ribosomal-protein-alanine N-acetyltransferase